MTESASRERENVWFSGAIFFLLVRDSTYVSQSFRLQYTGHGTGKGRPQERFDNGSGDPLGLGFVIICEQYSSPVVLGSRLYVSQKNIT